MKIRALTVEDMFSLVDLLAETIEAGSEAISKVLSTVKAETAPKGKKLSRKVELAQAEQSGIRIATLVLRQCWTHARPGTEAWLADVCGLTREEFLAQPPSLIMDIYDAVVGSPEGRDFFTRALRLARKMNGTVNTFLGGLGLSESTSDEQTASSDG